MPTKERAQAYVAAQQSLHLYEHVRTAFVDVLSALPEADFEEVTRNLTLMVLHEAAIAQVMHFEPTSTKYAVLQLTTPHDIPDDALRWVIAHELGHVLQKRNWQHGDGSALEVDASARAKEWGFEKTADIASYLDSRRARFGTA